MRTTLTIPSRLIFFNVLLACSQAPSVPSTLDGGGAPIDAAPDTAVTRITRLGFCPTAIDVFGYSNVLFAGCGGAGVPADAPAAGLFAPGTEGYDRTLAGRLQARLSADAELTARFGSRWTVRSCARGGGVVGTFAATALDARDTTIGSNLEVCTSTPAPLALFSANNVYDTFHGGGRGQIPDDPDTYAAHWAGYFQQFLDERHPAAVLVSPQHEWHGEQGGALDVPGSCTWLRPTWNRAGLAAWRAQHRTVSSVTAVGDLQDVFMTHHACCAQRGVTCADNWFAPATGGDGWVHFGCAGADALATWWFTTLKTYLLAHQFTCP